MSILTERVPRFVFRSVLSTLSGWPNEMNRATYNIGTNCAIDVTAVIQFLRSYETRNMMHTHKLIVMANETLRLYDPSTLFDTQALEEGKTWIDKKYDARLT